VSPELPGVSQQENAAEAQDCANTFCRAAERQLQLAGVYTPKTATKSWCPQDSSQDCPELSFVFKNTGVTVG